MLPGEKFLTLHPEGKQGVNIAKDKYETIKMFILRTLRERREISFQELCRLAVEQLARNFSGKVTWYVVSVKLDLEARGLIERVPGAGPQRLRLRGA